MKVNCVGASVALPDRFAGAVAVGIVKVWPGLCVWVVSKRSAPGDAKLWNL